MFKGIDTQYTYETCIQRGFCEEHSLELIQDDITEIDEEFLRKAMLFIRINVIDPVYFKKFLRCDKAKIILERLPHFSECISGHIPEEAYDSILILDSVAVFTLCHLSKICCFGALFKFKTKLKSTDPEIKLLYNLLHTERLQESDISHLNPLLQKNFIGCDLNLIKICYASTILFVRNVCIKQNIQYAIETIEKDLLAEKEWEDFKVMGDTAFIDKKYDSAINFYNTALTCSLFQIDVLADRALSFIKLEKYKQAQMDSYIAVIIDPTFSKGYCQLASSLFYQNMYKEALEVANCGLSLTNVAEVLKDLLETMKIDSEIKLNIRKNEEFNNKPNSIKENKEETHNFPDLIAASDSDEGDSEKFPDLIEASDSDEGDSELPELVDGSDSDESGTMKKKQMNNSPVKNKKHPTSKKKRNIPQVLPDLRAVEEPLENAEIDIFLKEASEAILADCGFKALQIFRGPLRNFIESPETSTTLQECEIVCIKYAYGFAYCKSGEYDDLQKSILIFKEIIEKYESINFPAAYYALGLTYRKLNRFRDARIYLEKVKNILSKGIHFKVYSWPGMTAAIKETKSEILNELVDDLIKECDKPPNPDAVCRFIDCEFQPAIYYTDPDFKGYLSVTCSDQCCLQYHVQCWKTLKTQKELTDKEFLEEPCATPDCDGIIIKVQHIDKKGDVSKEFVSDSKKVGKNRWAKWEKKADVKEKKKKKTHNKTEDGNSENTIEEKVNSRKNSFSRRESESSVEYSVANVVQIEGKESESGLKQSSIKQNEVSSNTPSCNEGVQYEIISSNGPFKWTTKTSIVKESPTNNAKDTCETGKDTFSGSIKQNSFFSSSKSAFHEPDTTFAKETQTKNSQEAVDSVSNSIKGNIYSYMSEFLQLHGPLKIDDPILLDELSIFPEEILETIKGCGGIGEFLKNDISFAYVGDIYVCDISDVGTAYQMLTNSSLPSDIKNLGSLESTENIKLNKNNSTSIAQSYTLNPDAREYTPCKASDLNSKNNYKHLNSSSLLKNAVEYPFVNTVFKLPQSMSKSTTNQNACEFPANKDTAKNTSFCNPYFIPKLSFSTPSLNTKAVAVSNNCVNKPFSFELQNKLSEYKTSSEIKSTVTSLNDSNNKSISGSISKESISKEITRIFNSGNNEMKDVKEFGDTLFELIKLYYSNKLSSHHQAINLRIKPYLIKKIVEMSNTASLTDKVEEFSIENAGHDTDSLIAENQHLLEQNIKLENEICSVKKQVKDLSEELSNAKKSLEAALSEIKISKDELVQKEEDFVNMRKNLYDTLKDAYETIDKQRKGAEVFKEEKNCLQKELDNLKLSAEEDEKKLIAEIESQVQECTVKIRNVEKENDALKDRAKNADLQVLNFKKTEFLKKIEEKTSEATKRRKEVTDGLTMISSNLNPLFQASITTLTAQLGTFIKDLNTIKINFVMKIDKQIEAVKSGSLPDLKEIEIITLPEMPSIEKTLTSSTPVLDKSLLGGNQPSLTFASARASAAASAGLSLPSVMIPPVAAMFPASSYFSQSSPFSVPSSLPLGATALPTASVPISSESKRSEDLTKNDSVTLLDLNHLQKSLNSSTSSVNSSASASLPSPECFLNDNVPHKNLHNFDHPISLSNCKAESSKLPPGIQKSVGHEFSKAPGTNMISKPLHSKSNSSTYTLNGGLEAIPKVSEEEKKKTSTSNQSNYEKLLSKLKDQFPGYTQEQLISFLKEFRNQRQGKLSGLPMDNIISQIGVIINSKKAEKKVPTKGLVNKKLVPDPKPKDPSPEPTTVKKKCAWGVDAAAEKKWSGNLNPTEDDCVICHEDMSNVSAYKVQCGHIFHEKCIKQWLQLKSDCPVCRVLLLLPEDYPSLS